MKKTKLREIEQNIQNNIDCDKDQQFLINQIVKSALIKIGVVLIMFILSVCFKEKISKLTTITSSGFFGNNIVLGPSFYYILLVVFGLALVVIVAFLLIRQNQIKKGLAKTKKILKMYSIYDFVSFCLMTMIVFSFTLMFAITPCNVDGDSMNNTYQNGDRLIVWHLGYTPKDDDAIIIDVNSKNYDYHDDSFFIKRIVGVPGDTLKYQAKSDSYGEMMINGEFEVSVYASQFEKICGIETEHLNNNAFVIPEDKYVVLGDNRNNSTDSRKLGLINRNDILGKVLFRMYPFNKIGLPDKDIAK